MKNVLLYLWQLPQNLLGLIIILLCGAKSRLRHVQANKTTYKLWMTDKIPSGVSLGRYIIMPKLTDVGLVHESGHQIQSLKLGWFYLLTVGIVSGARRGLRLYKQGRYYCNWPENQADALAGIVWENGRRVISR